MTKYNRDYQSGFTLLEVLIALFIFSIGILGVNAMQLTSIQGNSKANRITEASNDAADRIETFLSLGYADPLLVDGDGDGTNQDANDDGIDDNGGNFGLDDATAATADGNIVFPDGYNLFWNVAIGEPFFNPDPSSKSNTKTIRVIVDPPGTGSNVSMTYIKGLYF